MEDLNAKDECVEALNFVIGKFGYALVASTLHDRMKQDYTFMKKYFEEKKSKEPKEVKEAKPVKEKEVVEKEVVEPVDVEQVEQPKEEEVEPVIRTPKEIKVWQKEQEDKKRKEQESKGINPKELLTKENLQKWYAEEGRTFAYIAREYVGCKDSEVSHAVKLFDIESSRKNVMIYKAKK